jgi:phospholipid/cholesterol/gamma-HCH transport system substrate-binding protein
MWVGLFVVIGIILLILMTLKIEKFGIGKKEGSRVYIYFDSAAGLARNAPIRVAGVNVGNVERIALEGGKAKVTFHLPPDIVLYKNAKAYLKSEGFLGEKFVEISPGTADHAKLEPEGAVAQGAPPSDIEQFLSQVGSIREDLKEITKPLGDLLKSVDPKKVEGMVDNFNKFSGQLTGLGKDAKETIQTAKEAFSRMEEIGALKNVSEKIEKGEGTLGKLIKDESLYEDAKKTLQSVKGIAEKVEKGEGTLGKLVNDDHLMKEAEKTMKKIQKAAESIEEQTPITVLGTIIGIFF